MTPSTVPASRRTWLWLVALVVGINLVVWVAGAFARDGSVSGPEGSSYVTTGKGSAAVAGLLERLDVQVERLRMPVDESTLDPAQTLVLIEIGGSEYSTAELVSIDSFIRKGGHLVVVGSTDMVDRLLDEPPTWRSKGLATATARGAHAERVGLKTVPLSGFGSLTPGSDDSAVLAENDVVIAIERSVGEGSFSWMADSGPFHNDGIGNGESAVFVVGLIGTDAPVVFDEFHHGYSDQAGFWQLLSPRWRLAIILASITGVLALVSYGRRFGPAHDLERRLPPGRERYLEAVAGILGRAGAGSDALNTIRTEALARLDLPHHDSAASAAAAAGLEPDETEALLGDRDDDETLLIADRALAALTEERQ